MRIGVIGASGTLGRVWLTRMAAREVDDEMWAFVRRADAELARHTKCVERARGVLDFEALVGFAADCDVVVNLAAKNPAGQERDLRDVGAFFLVNGLGAAFVAEACARTATPLLHVSSVAVYEVHAYREAVGLDEASHLPSLDAETQRYFEAVQELVRDTLESPSAEAVQRWAAQLETHRHPVQASVYGLSKLVGERAVVERSVRSCCLRLSDVFGPGHESRGVVIDHLKALHASDEIVVDLGFRKTAYLIDIDDALSVVEAFAGRLGRGAELAPVVNVVGHCLDESMLALAIERLASGLGRSPTVRVAVGGQPKYDRRYRSNVLYTNLPGFVRTPFDESLAKTWDAARRAFVQQGHARG